MKDAFVGDPSLLVVDKSLRPHNNDIVLAVVNDEFTVKYYRADNNEVTLYPANERYKPLRIIDGMTFYVFGVVTFTIIDNRQLNRVRTHRL
jgi:DNA polymerase V